MRLLAFLLLPLLAASTVAQADPVDDFVLEEMKRTNTPGIAIAIVRDGKIVREQGFGLANVEHQVAVKPETVFQSGSVGKQFTAALVMLLAEEGKLNLDDSITKYLPNSPKAWQRITVHHLLTHTGGVGDPEKKVNLRKDYSDAEMIALAASMPLRFQPGQRWEYSNTGYHLLGFILNKAGGKFYGEQLRERIFAPLGMGTQVISESDIVPHRAAGYLRDGGKLKNQEWVSPTMNRTADGSLYLTARDLALWDLALHGGKILSARAKEASWTPVKLQDGSTYPYGFGWELRPVNGHRRVAHNGLWQGFHTQISRFIDDKLTVIVLGNSASAPAEKIASKLAAHYLPGLIKPALADTEPEVTALARHALANMQKGVQPPALSKQAKRVFTPQFMRLVAADMRELGKLNSLETIDRIVKGTVRGYHFRAHFDNETFSFQMAVNKAGEIEGIEGTQD